MKQLENPLVGVIAFTGKYNFKKSNGDIDVNAMVSELEKYLKRHFWKTAYCRTFLDFYYG